MNTKTVEASKKKNQCPICSKVIIGSSFKFRSHMYQHKAVNSRFQCEYCSNEYFRKDVYEKHVRAHTGKRKMYICDHCERGFVEKRNLILHLKVHDEYYEPHKFQYKCIACGASFCEERLLKYHIRKKHFNFQENEPTFVQKELNETWVERVLESEVCVEITKVNNNIINIKKSLNSKEVTPKENDEKSRFKEYMFSVIASKEKSQYSKAICDYCKKEMLKKSLLAHIRERHLRIKKFSCEQCKQGFSRHYQLVDHICGKYKSRVTK
ncbi:zinc finger protein 62-like [Helicoverpa zea]|uniref:zinc finger protein 62-like n=1 Tax=Helicoverpa zea TaxID=7113 RepID=UPI001F596954|nr:zinc finger protein 62-like [Helicoverpa zea]